MKKKSIKQRANKISTWGAFSFSFLITKPGTMCSQLWSFCPKKPRSISFLMAQGMLLNLIMFVCVLLWGWNRGGGGKVSWKYISVICGEEDWKKKVLLRFTFKRNYGPILCILTQKLISLCLMELTSRQVCIR